LSWIIGPDEKGRNLKRKTRRGQENPALPSLYHGGEIGQYCGRTRANLEAPPRCQ
jgi:hypothetical protein